MSENRPTTTHKLEPLDNLMASINELEQDREWQYTEIPIKRIITQTDKAVLLEFDRYCFANTKNREASVEIWFPLSMMRQYESGIYFQKFVAKDKGLNV